MLHVENNALIDVWLVTTNDCIRGTDQSGNLFWENALTKWRHRLRDVAEGRAAREGRGKETLRKQWGKLLAGVMEVFQLLPEGQGAEANGQRERRGPDQHCGQPLLWRVDLHARANDYAEDLKN